MKILLIISLFLFSCSASKKVVIESKTIKNNDSIAIVKIYSSHKGDSVAVKTYGKEITQAIELMYEPLYTDTSFIEIELNGNKLKVPTKGLKNFNTKQKSNHYRSDSIGFTEEEMKVIESDVRTKTRETTFNKSSTEKKGWIADLFGGSLNKLVWIIAAFIIIVITGIIIFFIYKRRRK